MMKNAVLMCRVSSDEQAKGHSLDVQDEQLRKYCDRNEINIVKVYREDHSAKSFDRPEFKNFLQFAKLKKNRVDTLLITSWDRFSRNITESLNMLSRLEKMGIQVHAIEQPIDMSVPENKLMLSMYLVLPEIDNDRRSIKIRGGIRAAYKAGRWPRKAPFGYKNTRDENNRPIIVPHEKNAKHVKHIFQKISMGRSGTEMQSYLKGKGIRASHNMISCLLRNPIYTGKIYVPAYQDEPEMFVRSQHDPIISDELFFKVQDVLQENYVKKKRPVPVTDDEEFVLKGILDCNCCGHRMTASRSRGKSGKRYAYYHCPSCGNQRERVFKINDAVESVLSDLRFNNSAKTIFNKLLELNLKKDGKESIADKKTLKREIEKLEERVDKLNDMYFDGEMDNEMYKRTIARYHRI